MVTGCLGWKKGRVSGGSTGRRVAPQSGQGGRRTYNPSLELGNTSPAGADPGGSGTRAEACSAVAAHQDTVAPHRCCLQHLWAQSLFSHSPPMESTFLISPACFLVCKMKLVVFISQSCFERLVSTEPLENMGEGHFCEL